MNKFHVSETWFTLILSGIKIKGIFKELKIGDVVEWIES